MSDEAVDFAGAYRELRERLTALVTERPATDLERPCPATPDWRLRDVVAHLGGVCDDILSGNMAGVATDDWTLAQVDARRGLPFDEVLATWEEHAVAVEAIMNDLGPAIGQMLADAATHEQDVRGALDAPGARDARALVLGFDWGLWALGQRYDGEDAGSLIVEHEAGTATAGTGEHRSRVRASRFEIARSMTGRRSEAQMQALDWDGPALDLVVSRDVFTPPAADLVE